VGQHPISIATFSLASEETVWIEHQTFIEHCWLRNAKSQLSGVVPLLK